MKRLLAVILCLTLISCSSYRDDRNTLAVREKMGWLYDANPNEDALSSISRGDYRFVAVYGYSLVIPGVPMDCFSSFAEIEKWTKPIDGTSDAVDNYEHAKLNEIARVYAGWYNVQILIYLKDKNYFDCAIIDRQ
ncbi:MAG: hypothetical protein H6999_05005 [Hahellaceae bacterium]|nr:hypothetical protein [Hahellaceae bacterium]MCP5168988.1 hypothetical protein [Hahellaceae bacterium]MCP5169097.1 hypothetical protein [Hahellaceae bacterium]